MTVLVCGEALVDLVPTADGLLAPKLGGGPFNVAVTLGRLGSNVGFLSRLSTDPFGEQLIRRLAESGVDTELVQRGPEPTTLALTSIDDAGSAQYTFYADGTADRLVVDPGELPDTVSALSFGTLSLLYEPGATVYEKLLRRSHAAGRVVMLDPNVRPAAITDPSAYRARFDGWLPHIDVLKVSEDDMQWLTAQSGATAHDWLDAGVGALDPRHPDHAAAARAALRYVPSKKLLSLVRSGELCCTFPGCTNPVWHADVDHSTPYAHHNPSSGGLTVRENLKPLCRFHHRTKTFGRWRDYQLDLQTAIFVSPTGHCFVGNAFGGLDLFPKLIPTKPPDHPARRTIDTIHAQRRAKVARAEEKWNEENPPPY